jgi:subtilisin-like proprotein convertase family protein
MFTFSVFGQANNGVFSNSQTIEIRDFSTAIPYHSDVTVSGLSGTLSDINVRLNGLSHTYISDIALLLVSPDRNIRFVLMSDCGENLAASNITITFDDQAANLVPCNIDLGPATAVSGSYRPTSRPVDQGDGILAVDYFPPPAPQPPESYSQPVPTGRATLNESFGGISPNGVWSLYVVDNYRSDEGTISGGYSLIITTSNPCTYSFNPPIINVASNGGAGSFVVTTQNGCIFSSIPSDNFITIESGATGTGTTTVNFFVYTNTGAARTGTINVGGQIFTINQAASKSRKRIRFTDSG